MLRRCLSFVFGLMLVVTSHSVVLARGSETAVDQMVICKGSQAVTVYIDASGEPTLAPHMCPDCTLLGLDGLPRGVFVLGRAPVFSHQAATEAALAMQPLAYSHAMVRAPPVSI